MVRPLALPLLTRLNARLDHRLRLHEQNSSLTAFQQHLPALLNAISTQNAAAREMRRAELHIAGTVDQLEQTVRVLGAAGESRGGAGRRAAGRWTTRCPPDDGSLRCRSVRCQTGRRP